MADYIDKNILVQAYVKLNKDINEFSPDEIIETQLRLQSFAVTRSQFFLNADIDAEVELEEGSVIAWLTVVGGVCHLISQYSDFRQGVKLLYADAKRLSEYLISETMFELKGRTGSTIRVEARVGVIGNVNNIVAKLTTVEQASGEFDLRKVIEILEHVLRDIKHLFGNIRSTEDKKYLKTNITNLAKRIPPKPRKPQRGQHHPDDIAAYEEELKELLELLHAI